MIIMFIQIGGVVCDNRQDDEDGEGDYNSCGHSGGDYDNFNINEIH